MDNKLAECLKEDQVIERIKMVKAMEFIARHVNDETVFETWLISGVADGDIKLGDLSVQKDDKDELEYYLDDESFSDLMAVFLRLMSGANRWGGLYCGNVVSK